MNKWICDNGFNCECIFCYVILDPCAYINHKIWTTWIVSRKFDCYSSIRKEYANFSYLSFGVLKMQWRRWNILRRLPYDLCYRTTMYSELCIPSLRLFLLCIRKIMIYGCTICIKHNSFLALWFYNYNNWIYKKILFFIHYLRFFIDICVAQVHIH